MKNLNKLIRKLQSYYCLGFCFCILQAQVVITEFFINSAEGTQIPQYIELYNTSDTTVSIENWSIITLVTLEDEIEFTSSNKTEFDGTNGFVMINAPLEIDSLGYFLISSYADGYNFYNGNSDIEVYFKLYELEANIEGVVGEVMGGSIILINNNNNGIDTVEFNIEENWPLGEESRGYSLRLHVAPDSVDNDSLKNWSLSPETEKSSFLYEGSQVLNYGSPRKENALKINNIQYLGTVIDSGGTHIISGDVNNIYNADNDNAPNNYGDPLLFSWVGTFDNISGQEYKLIIEKTNIKTPEKHGFEIDSDPDTTLTWVNITETEISVNPQSLFINELEIADYSWTVELTKGVDTIYSDRYTFTINARDYGVYGCVDHSSCTVSASGYPTCPTTADDDTLKSNHPVGCTPGDDCYSALNYHETTNINSNTCHYVSLSIPAFITGDSSAVVTVPVYLYNDSSANIDSIAYTLSFNNSSGIVSYNEDGSTFTGTILSGLGDENIIYDGTNDISVNMALSAADISINGAGIITYIDFELIGSPGEITDLLFSDVSIKGGAPENNIQVPVKDGEIVILQPDYEIKGNVVYYYGDDPYEVPNVELTLNKMYDGVSANTSYIDTTNEFGLFKFKSLMEGNYSLSFSKEEENDCNEDSTHISGVDLYFIALHVTGSEPFNSNQEIAGDVSLDGTVSGLDASLVAQYIVGLNSNFNDVNIHWVFKPANLESLPSVHAELIYENGQYRIDYQPLVFDDKGRDINAYLLGDVTGNYCDSEDQSRYKNDNLQFNDIIVEYKPIISIPIILTESVHIQGMDIEIGYDKDIFEPLSITFNSLNQLNENYESLSNLSGHEGSIKTVIWATDEPQLINGIIGEVSFSWGNNNEAGKIWLKKFIINDTYAIGGLKLPDIDDEEIAEGLNIINELYPEVLSLKQNYPNPFNPQTSIFWSMPGPGKASIEIYNLKGQFIDILFDGYKEPGSHDIIWNASAYPSGIYFYRLTIGETVLQKKMILLR